MFYLSMQSDIDNFYIKEIQSQNVLSYIRSIAIVTKKRNYPEPSAVTIALVTQRKGNSTALQPQFYSFYFDQQSLLYSFES